MQTAEPAPLLQLAVVGHTNTGKTSLLRTLTRDPDFGEVADAPGTTRHVEGVRLLVDGRPLAVLYDTPGLEDSMGLLDYLDQHTPSGTRQLGPQRIQQFLALPAAQGRYEQEARVLRQLLACDAGLYVIDARDPVLGKHQDELAILAQCGKPLLPVLNFINTPEQHVDTWRHALAKLGLHVTATFDTVAPALDGEATLYDKLALVLDAHADTLRTLQQDIARQQAARRQQADQAIAELLIDVAALRLSALPDTDTLTHTAQQLRQHVRQHEQDCVTLLLALYNFRSADFPAHALPLEGERWGMDVFNPQALKDMGIRLSKGMAAGAMTGLTIDLLTAGMSLGAAAALGATLGGLWQGADHLGKRVMGRLRGYRELSVDDSVLRLLGLRQLALVTALQKRGHAAVAPITLPDGAAANATNGTASSHPLRQRRLPEPLLLARTQPHWSRLSADHRSDTAREANIRALAAQLRAAEAAHHPPTR